MIKSLPRETRTIMSHLCKRPLEKLLVDDLKIHTLSEQYSTIYRIAQKDYGEAQVEEKDMSAVHHYRYTRGENEWLQQPIRSWDDIRNADWLSKTRVCLKNCRMIRNAAVLCFS